jgi:disulfide bond formation protein DsbB
MSRVLIKTHFGLVLASILALAVAYISQYHFGFEPCPLCLYQRLPYMLVIVLSALGVLSSSFLPRFSSMFLALSVLSLIVGTALALYHVGIEYGVFSESVACDDARVVPETLQALREQILGTSAVSCAEPALLFLGFSMAAWNALYSFVISMVTLKILLRLDEQHG